MVSIIDINGIARECESIQVDPDNALYVKATFVSKRSTHHTYTEWYDVDSFVKNNPTFKDFANNVPEITDELGIVTSSGDNYLCDNTKNWKLNLFKDSTLWISRGKGEGQLRKVTISTKDTLYVDKNWEETPDERSQYVLSKYVYAKIKPVGNSL